jgi:twitching motility protein PilT
MGVGKTTTGASFVVERLKLYGGMALAIEDPTETNINGVHGEGRCIAISASRYNGGYKEHLVRGLRSGVDFFFIGEIRDEETGFEALKAGTNGKLIFATMHAASIPLSLERMITLASQFSRTAADTLAESLLAVVWQNLEEAPKQGGGTFKRFTSNTLVLSGDDAGQIRERIRRNDLSSLDGEIDRQAARQIWGRES